MQTVVTFTAQKYHGKCYWSSPVQNNVQLMIIMVILGGRNLRDFPFHCISWPLCHEHVSITGLPVWFIKSLVPFEGLDLLPASYLQVCLITGNLQSAYVCSWSLNGNFLPRDGAQKCHVKNLYTNLLTYAQRNSGRIHTELGTLLTYSLGRGCLCRWGQEWEEDFPCECITYSK